MPREGRCIHTFTQVLEEKIRHYARANGITVDEALRILNGKKGRAQCG